MKRSRWTAPACLVLTIVATCIVRMHARADEQSPARSLEQIQAVFDSLKVDDVAWRTVHWKTCLIDGLQESRRTKKPLMLWVFIDRPIDDERC